MKNVSLPPTQMFLYLKIKGYLNGRKVGKVLTDTLIRQFRRNLVRIYYDGSGKLLHLPGINFLKKRDNIEKKFGGH